MYGVFVERKETWILKIERIEGNIQIILPLKWSSSPMAFKMVKYANGV